MDSSPPLPAQQSPSAQTSLDNDTAYSLDLNALAHGSEDTGADSLLPVKKLDEVRSEDIDGPSDFTLNLEDWMRGTHKKGAKPAFTSMRSTMNRGAMGKRGTVRGMFAPNGQEQIVEEDPAHEKDFGRFPLPQSTADRADGFETHEDTPIPDLDDSVLEHEGERYAEPRSGTATPRVSKENDSSLWDALGPDSSSAETSSARRQHGDDVERERISHIHKDRPDMDHRRAHLLQPTVEDYNSEISPGRPLSAPPLPSHLFRSDERSDFSLAPTPPPHRLRQTRWRNEDAEAARKELNAAQLARDQAELRAQTLDEQLRASNQARRSLQSQLDATTDTLAASNAAHSRPGTSEGGLRATVTALERTLAGVRSERDELREQLREMRSSEDVELEELRWRVKEQGEGGDESVRLLREENEMLRAELRVAQEHNPDRTRRLTDTSRPATEGQQKQPPPQQLSSDKDKELADARREIEELQDELDILQNLSRLENDDDDDVAPKGTGMQTSAAAPELEARIKALQDLADERLRQINELTADLRSARATATLGVTSTAADGEDEEGLRASAARQRVEAELRESERKRLSLHARLDEVGAELAALRTANADLDRRVADSLRKREEGWLGREAAWEKERRVMAKALLRQWGREEEGVDFAAEEQRYRYRFVAGKTPLIT